MGYSVGQPAFFFIIWRQMMHSEEEENIILKFKRHGQPINRKSLERTMAWLKESPSHSLEVLLKKLNQLAL